MAKNRYFKSTVGIDFELVLAKAISTKTTVADLVDPATAVGDLLIVSATAPKETAVTNISSADQKLPINFFTVEQNKSGKNIVNLAPGVIASTLKAELNAYKAPVMEVATITQSGGTISEKQTVTVKVIELTPGQIPLPTWSYEASLAGGLTAAFTKIAAAINATKDEEFFTASNANGVLTVTSTDATRNFRLAATVNVSNSDFEDYGVDFTVAITTPAYAGNGTLDQIQEMWREYSIKRGVSHFYPDQGTNGEEFGLPADISTTTGGSTFDIVTVSGYRFEDSPTPVERHVKKAYVFIVVPAGTGASILSVLTPTVASSTD